MMCNPGRYHRRSIRLRNYDYSRKGAYFVTVCTKNRECLFGDVVAGEMRLNAVGKVILECWENISAHFPHVALDAVAIMPNHVHGILFITDAPVGAKDFSPLSTGQRQCGTSKTVGSIIRGFKIGLTKWMRSNTTVVDVWQRGFYERIIRDEMELTRIREYIHGNAKKWGLDRENPNRVKYPDQFGVACPDDVEKWIYPNMKTPGSTP